jgi:class 3 adenylate cyclase
VSVEGGRYLAAHIPGARYVELPGSDHVLWAGDVDQSADEIEEFLTGARSDFEADRVLASVLFTDLVDSTRRAAEMGDRAWRVLLGEHDKVIRREIARFQGREIKTLGDGFLVTFDGPARAVRCARAIMREIRELGLAIRSGVHTGEIDRKGEDIGGIAVNIAARIADLAPDGQVLVSRTVRDLVAGSNLRFEDRGSTVLKGLNEPVSLYEVSGDG